MNAVTVEPDHQLAALAGPDVAWQYAARAPVSIPADALAWARASFEGSPLLMRLFLVVGWAALILEGGPRSDATRVLGWPITECTPQVAVLQRRSRLGIQATLLFATEQDVVTFSSAMVFTNRFGQVVWSAVAPIHRWAARFVLSQASTAARIPEAS